MCTKGAEWNHRQKVEEEYHMGTASYFQAYRQPLEAMNYFKYLGRVLTVSYDDWPEVVSKFRKTQRKWVRMSRILVQEGSDYRNYGIFYNAEVHETLLFLC